ncbi:MAG: pilus assembly protein TadG-related protein [Actinomycetota bacterium]
MKASDRGDISVMAMLLMLVVFAASGLIIDGGRAMAARRHASNTAEAAARAAVATLTPLSDLDPVAARAAAIGHATRAGVAATDVVVEVGSQSVRVTVVERRRSVFLALGGVSVLTVRATGVARAVFSP